MYDDGDPYLTELRELCFAYPESVEVEAWGRPTFRAGKKIFAMFNGDDDHPYTVTFKPDADDRDALLEDHAVLRASVLGPEWLVVARLRRAAGRLGRGERVAGRVLSPGCAQADVEGARHRIVGPTLAVPARI